MQYTNADLKQTRDEIVVAPSTHDSLGFDVDMIRMDVLFSNNKGLTTYVSRSKVYEADRLTAVVSALQATFPDSTITTTSLPDSMSTTITVDWSSSS